MPASTSGKNLLGSIPSVFPSVDPSTNGKKFYTYSLHSQIAIFLLFEILFQVSKLRGAGMASRPETSPYVISQMLVPLEMLLGGIIIGFIALLAERRRRKVLRTTRTRSMVYKGQREIGKVLASTISHQPAEHMTNVQ